MNDIVTDPDHPATYPAATLWPRLGAILYDSIVVLALWMLVGYLVLYLFGIDNARSLEEEGVVLNPLYRATLFSAMLLSAFAFFGLFWTRSGQTIGMLAWRVKVQNADGSPVSWWQALQRFFWGGLSLLCAGLGHWWILLDSQRAGLSDHLSRSCVVRVPKGAR